MESVGEILKFEDIMQGLKGIIREALVQHHRNTLKDIERDLEEIFQKEAKVLDQYRGDGGMLKFDDEDDKRKEMLDVLKVVDRVLQRVHKIAARRYRKMDNSIRLIKGALGEEMAK